MTLDDHVSKQTVLLLTVLETNDTSTVASLVPEHQINILYQNTCRAYLPVAAFQMTLTLLKKDDYTCLVAAEN